PRRRGDVIGLPFEAREQLEVLAGGEPVVERRPLRDPADANAVHALDAPGARFQRTCENGQQRGLPGAVRADQRQRLTAAHIDVGRLERNLRPEPAPHTTRAEERLRATQRRSAAVSPGGTSRFPRTPSTGPL